MQPNRDALLAEARWLATHPHENDLRPDLMADTFAQLLEARGGRVNYATIGPPCHRIGAPEAQDAPRGSVVPHPCNHVLGDLKSARAANPIIAATEAARPAILGAIKRRMTGLTTGGGDAA